MNTILTPCILQTIIICCTIIIITVIAVSAYRVNKGQQRSWRSYIYYASILSIFTISIFSYCFYGNRNILDFVSLASALISIILAVITIIYSFYSNSQSVQPGLSVTEFAKQSILVPSLSVQKKIAAILSSLNDKIELNRGINDNLEQQAQALFKSGFVDNSSSNWNETTLSDVATFIGECHYVNLFDVLVTHTDLTQNADVIGNAKLLLVS